MKQRSIALLVVGFAVVVPQAAHAWGTLGHRMIAETAAMLLEDEMPQGWGLFLSRHRFEMGFYSILPDSLFRYKDGSKGDFEGPTHFFDINYFGPHIPTVLRAAPADPKEARKFFIEKIGKEKAEKVGSAPWRVGQLVDIAKQQLSGVKAVVGKYQIGADSEGDAKAIFNALYTMGVMAHYTGDSTMPYHSTSDWNGYDHGQGGIHFYFESDCVNALEPGLSTDILKLARKNGARWLKEWGAKVASDSPVHFMYEVFIENLTKLEATAKIDTKVVVEKLAPLGTQAWAKRKPYRKACPAFREMLVERLAKGSVLTARMWKATLPGGVDFSKAHTLTFADFEWKPEFIQPIDFE